jgi:hypothetical protein
VYEANQHYANMLGYSMGEVRELHVWDWDTQWTKEQLPVMIQEALAEIKTLRGILARCSYSKKIRNNEGCWEPVDVYIRSHSQADNSHGICPECLEKHFPELD